MINKYKQRVSVADKCHKEGSILAFYPAVHGRCCKSACTGIVIEDRLSRIISAHEISASVVEAPHIS